MPVAKTMGIVVLAPFAASPESVEVATSTAAPPNEIGCQCRKPIILSFGKAIFDRDVLPFDETQFLQALAESCLEWALRAGRATAQISNDRLIGPLRPRGQRPRRGAAEQGDERAPFQLTKLHPLPRSQGSIANCKHQVRGSPQCGESEAINDRFGSWLCENADGAKN